MNGIERVTALCQLLVTEELAIADTESALKKRKALALTIKRVDLPELMKEFDLKSFGLNDGTKIEIKEDVEANISEDNRAAAHAWLVEHGFGGLIKTQVVVAFGRDQQEEAEALAARLREEHDDVAEFANVHPQTLKAFVREQMEKGNALPESLFGISPFSFAKITFKKEK